MSLSVFLGDVGSPLADPAKRMRKRSISFSKMNTVELYVPGEQLEIKNAAPAPNPHYQTSSSVAFDKKVRVDRSVGSGAGSPSLRLHLTVASSLAADRGGLL